MNKREITDAWNATAIQRNRAQRWSAAWKQSAKRYRKYTWDFAETAEYWQKMWAKDVRDARDIARRLLRERDALQSQVNHLESDRDALAKQCDELRGALEEIRDKGIDFDCPSCGEEFSWFPSERLYKALGKA